MNSSITVREFDKLDLENCWELTEQEIDLVSGATPLGAAVGAAVTGLGYLGSSTVTGNFSWGGFGASLMTGAAIGATSGVSTFTAYVAPRVSYFGGMIMGGFDGYNDNYEEES